MRRGDGIDRAIGVIRRRKNVLGRHEDVVGVEAEGDDSNRQMDRRRSVVGRGEHTWDPKAYATLATETGGEPLMEHPKCPRHRCS